ncbi:MAG: hypothetical protein ACK5LX_02425 [Oscillospiraceae bacterium]
MEKALRWLFVPVLILALVFSGCSTSDSSGSMSKSDGSETERPPVDIVYNNPPQAGEQLVVVIPPRKGTTATDKVDVGAAADALLKRMEENGFELSPSVARVICSNGYVGYAEGVGLKWLQKGKHGALIILETATRGSARCFLFPDGIYKGSFWANEIEDTLIEREEGLWVQGKLVMSGTGHGESQIFWQPLTGFSNEPVVRYTKWLSRAISGFTSKKDVTINLTYEEEFQGFDDSRGYEGVQTSWKESITATYRGGKEFELFSRLGEHSRSLSSITSWHSAYSAEIFDRYEQGDLYSYLLGTYSAEAARLLQSGDEGQKAAVLQLLEEAKAYEDATGLQELFRLAEQAA